MKYSVNYYSKRNRDFKDTYNQVPKIFESTAIKQWKKTSAEDAEKVNGEHLFVVPWQMP